MIIGKPRYSKTRSNVDWKKDGVVLTARELVAVIKQYENLSGKRLIARFNRLFPLVTKKTVATAFTHGDLHRHVQKTQDRRFSLNALVQRADKLPRYNEFSPWHKYVVQAYLAVIGRVTRKHFTPAMIERRLEYCKHRCEYCDADLNIVHYVANHYLPVARGGGGEYANLRIACPTCNRTKSDMKPDEFIRKLTSKQGVREL